VPPLGSPGFVQGRRGQDRCEGVVRAFRAEAEVTARVSVMRSTLLAALAAFGIMSWWTPPAHPFVAMVATSVAAEAIDSDEHLDQAIDAALADMLKAIAVRPTVLQLQKVLLVGDRIYLLVLVADVDGEEMLKGLTRGALLDSSDEE
jgi:hypothetical protein